LDSCISALSTRCGAADVGIGNLGLELCKRYQSEARLSTMGWVWPSTPAETRARRSDLGARGLVASKIVCEILAFAERAS